VSRRIVVTVNRDGSIKAETLGIKGKACLDYVPLLEELLEAETVQSEFTAEYQGVDQHVTRVATETVGEQPPS
jgi:hypothetical protein